MSAPTQHGRRCEWGKQTGVMQEGAVSAAAERAGERSTQVPRKTASGGVIVSPAGKAPQTHRRGGDIVTVDGVLPGGNKVVGKGVNKDTVEVVCHG